MHAATGIRATLLALAIIGCGHVRAAESFDGCTNFVTSLPATIATPGTWCLTHDLATGAAGTAIDIAADDVILDCNGFRIDGSTRPAAGYATGIRANDRRRITVRNCRVRRFNGCVAVFAPNGVNGHHLVEDNRVDRCAGNGIHVSGNGSVVRRNAVLETVNTGLQQGATGISTTGTIAIEDNLVDGVQAHSAEPNGIRSYLNYGGSIRGNVVRGLRRTGNGALLFGIHHVSGSVGSTIRGNTVIGDGELHTIGVLCDSTKAILKDNFVMGFATDNYGCRDEGNVLEP